ncbi:MAG: STAS domain-containing protein [Chitinispirillaceae bacterium]|nr:STAS domain-containing protein [Chitinispirillaceae bacterium]
MESASDLSIRREEWNGWQILNLAGPFVVKSFNTVRRLFDELEATPQPRVAVDMTSVGQIDSSALTVILNLQKRLKAKGGRLAVIGPSKDISETFSIVGFSLAVPVYSSRSTFEKLSLQD